MQTLRAITSPPAGLRCTGANVLYTDARQFIRSGDLIAQSHGSWLTLNGIKSNIVRMFTRSTYSHVGIAWVVGGRVFVLEAVKPKLRIYPMSGIGDFYLLSTKAEWRWATEELALSKVGVDYSETAAMNAFFGPLDEGDVRQCAAYALTVLRSDGIDLGASAIPDHVVFAAMKRGANCVLISQ